MGNSLFLSLDILVGMIAKLKKEIADSGKTSSVAANTLHNELKPRIPIQRPVIITTNGKKNNINFASFLIFCCRLSIIKVE